MTTSRRRSHAHPAQVGLHPPAKDESYFQGLRPGDRVPSDWRSRELPGGLLKSAHRGRIIAVR